MAKCVYCGTETQLLDRGVPICLKCSDRIEAGEKLTREQPATKKD